MIYHVTDHINLFEISLQVSKMILPISKHTSSKWRNVIIQLAGQASNHLSLCFFCCLFCIHESFLNCRELSFRYYVIVNPTVSVRYEYKYNGGMCSQCNEITALVEGVGGIWFSTSVCRRYKNSYDLTFKH